VTPMNGLGPWAHEGFLMAFCANATTIAPSAFIDQQRARETRKFVRSRIATTGSAFSSGPISRFTNLMLPTGRHAKNKRLSVVCLRSTATGLRCAAACWSIPGPACCSTDMGWFAETAPADRMLRWWSGPGLNDG